MPRYAKDWMKKEKNVVWKIGGDRVEDKCRKMQKNIIIVTCIYTHTHRV